jgi:exportin-5
VKKQKQMESELNELIQAWKVCTDGSILDAKQRQNAYTFVENFKQTSLNLTQIGFYLANQNESFELSYFGYQLITHTIKFKWNDFDERLKSEIKSQVMNIIINLDSQSSGKQTRPRPIYLKNAMCLVIIELIKREWPQNWLTLINDLFDISNKSMEHKRFIFIILKYIAEEFIDCESSISQMPPQRRKDINQYLNQYMEKIFNFYLDCLEHCFTYLNSNSDTATASQAASSDITNLANVCLESLSNYINWFHLELVLSKNYSFVNISLSLLNSPQLCVNSAKCLQALVTRKAGTSVERRPLLGMFSESVLCQLINCLKLSMENAQFKELFKYLVQLLVGMGAQLSSVWDSSEFSREQRPACLNVYLNALYELLQADNRLHSFEVIQTWNSLLQNEFISQDADLKHFTILISRLLTNSYSLFKFTYSSMNNEFDNEEDFNKFLHKYRYELSRLVRLGSASQTNTFVEDAYNWSSKILADTSGLSPDDESGYDPKSFLYQCWDALIFLWSNISNVMVKTRAQLDIPFIRPKLIALISSSVQLSTKNANYGSFNYSFLGTLINLTCDHLCDSDENRLVILQTIVDKLFADLDLFRLESSKLLSPSLPPIANDQSSARLKSFFNVRRQISAIVLNICKSYGKLFAGVLESMFGRVSGILNQTDTTQMEKCILIQALVCLSNEPSQFALQSSLVKQFLLPILEFATANKSQLSSVDAFISLIGVNDQMGTASSQTGLLHRKLIFYHVNLMFGVLKTIAGHSIQSAELSPIFISLFEYLLDLIKCFNLLHSSGNINKEFLDMTDWSKTLVLGMSQEKHAQNQPTMSSLDTTESADKIIMFIFNTYDTLNQLIGLYLVKFKQELLLVPEQPGSEFIYKFGESVLTCLNELPDFRVRSLIKYVIKSLLTVVNFDKDMLSRNLLLVKLNQVLLEYFLPSILSRITETNRYYLSLKSAEQNNANNEELQSQIIAETQFILMCREFAELIRVLFNFNNQPSSTTPQQQHASTTANLSSTDMDDAGGRGDATNDENEMNMGQNANSDHGANGNANAQFNELVIYLMKTNKIIYQTIILCLFDGLNWSDSFCCLKLVRLGQTLIDKYPITSEQTPAGEAFTICLNEQASEQVFTLCLSALQVHGEHQDQCSQLINLAFSIFDKSPYTIKTVFTRLLAQIPGLNRKVYDEFVAKSMQQQQQQSTAARASYSQFNEKLKKDLFKKMIQPLIGKSLGQLYKNDIRIRVLEPLNLTTRRKLADCELPGGGKANADLSICSLFDPTTTN